MLNTIRQEIEWGGRQLRLETGRMARQADGAVVATYGGTVVLATVVAAKSLHPTADFLPLTVNYQEKYFAAGKIPGGFFKREARPTEKEVLTSRLIDRPIRPLFPKDWRYETQVIATVLSHDLENNPDIIAIIASSAALAVAGLSFKGPIAGVRVGFEDGAYLLNPPMPETGEEWEGRLDLVMAGTTDAVMMVEAEAHELNEEQMLDAVMFGHQQIQPIVSMIGKLAEEAGAVPRTYDVPGHDESTTDRVRECAEADLQEALALTQKKLRNERIAVIKKNVSATLCEEFEIKDPTEISNSFHQIERELVRRRVLESGIRIDGRDLVTVRPIECSVGELPCPHGSALFTRGETQALVTTTLGTKEDSQVMDTLHANYRERFLLHYNFPPYSVGEARRMMPPGRRETGHGKLAWRALRPVLPTAEEFPYTIRLVSEILESNGSSSMATVCGSSLSMMDAGVPLSGSVAGVAMGLILEQDRHAVLTDILGAEDHIGDMDFKVAGTRQGVTALQMDIKISGVNEEIMRNALSQAQVARLHILDEMAKAISESRKELSPNAPRVETITIPVEKIREVIGTGGKVIRKIVEETGAKVEVNDDGVVSIASPDQQKIDAARQRVLEITSEPEAGTVYKGTVVKLMEFGAFVNFFGAKDGLVHVSEMASHRVNHPSDIVSEGDEVRVLYTGSDDRGRAQLSLKAVGAQSLMESADQEPSHHEPSRHEPSHEPSRHEPSRHEPSRHEPSHEPSEMTLKAGKVYEGTITGIKDDCAMVDIGGQQDGLMHVSEMALHRVNHPSEMFSEGDEVKVLCTGTDRRGRPQLSMKTVDQNSGKIADDPEPEPGKVYEGTVQNLAPFGAFVNFLGSKSGLVHVSEMAFHRVNHPSEMLSEGDTVKVLCTGTDRRGRLQLSMKSVKQETGEVIPEAEPGKVYEGTVVRLEPFGAFVNFLESRVGLVHVSEMAFHRVEHPSDIVSEGDKVDVLFNGNDNRGRPRLSMKDVG